MDGGVKLKIKKSDAEKALIILKQYEQLLLKKETQEKVPYNYIKCSNVCPKCDSFNIYRKKSSLFKTIFSIVFAFTIIPFFFQKRIFLC